MKLSVIIPAFNEELRLPEALRALKEQDYPDFEIIVVDNASADRTAEIARSFPDVTVVSEARKGTMWACECGRKEAVGEIIVRMDADCLPDTDWLSRGAAYFADPEVSAVGGPYDYHDRDEFFRWSALLLQRSVYSSFNRLMQAVGKGAVLIGGNSFMRACVLERAGGFNTKLIFYGDDTDTAKRMASGGKVIFDGMLVIRSSARRFKDTGIVRLELRYIKHFLRVIFGGNE